MCNIGLPSRNVLMYRARVGGLRQRAAQRLVAEHLRQLGKNLQMLLGRLGRDEQYENEIDGLSVRCVEGDGRLQPDERAHRIAQTFDPPVRDRDTLPESRGAQTLASEQAVEYQTASDSLIVFEQQADLFEHALLTADLQVEQDVDRGKQLGDEVHELN